jgi:hypothetical protein
MNKLKYILLFSLIISPFLNVFSQKTSVSIVGEQFYINNKPTYEGRQWKGKKIEGLLMNSRMVQGIFDDLNVATRDTFAYADTKKWDPERNNLEFVAAMSKWKSFGLNAITVNMQGGSPFGYGNFDFYNPGFNADGSLNYGYMNRLDRILKKADDLGMVVILGMFYFGQDQRLYDETAIKRAVTELVNWLHDKKYRNVLLEIDNETQADLKHYDHEILLMQRVHELIVLAKSIERNGFRYNVSVSFAAQTVPTENVIKVADFVLFHCNALRKTEDYENHIAKVKKAVGGRKLPIVINEDDNHDFEADNSHFNIALKNHISWGFFDYRKKGDSDLKNGFQTIPVDWGINSETKKAFFYKVKEITGTKSEALTSKDFIKIEAESTKSPLGKWLKITSKNKNYVANASGKTYLEFMGNTPSVGEPNSPLKYTVKVPIDGNYRLLMMSSKRLEGDRGDWCNDAFVKLQGDFESATNLDKQTLGNYLKYFQEGSTNTPENEWHWAQRAERGRHEFFDLVYKLKKGETYTLTLAGRSQRFSVDYMVFYNADKTSLAEAKAFFVN